MDGDTNTSCTQRSALHNARRASTTPKGPVDRRCQSLSACQTRPSKFENVIPDTIILRHFVQTCLIENLKCGCQIEDEPEDLMCLINLTLILLFSSWRCSPSRVRGGAA